MRVPPSNQSLNPCSGLNLNRFQSFAKDSRAGASFQNSEAIFDANHRAFPQTDNQRLVLFEELENPLLPGLTLVR